MKRICVYFVGHLRNLQETWTQYKRLFQDTSCKFDFFFVLWKHCSKDTNLPVLYERCEEPLSEKDDVDEQDIYAICPEAKLVVLLDDHAIPIELANYRANIILQLYCLQVAFSKLPNDYDFYIRMRTDLYFFRPLPFSTIVCTTTDLILEKTVHWYSNNFPHSNLFADFFWISKYDAGRIISELYAHIGEFDSSLCLEEILALYLRKFPALTYSHIDFNLNLDRRTKGIENWLPETAVCTNRRNKEGEWHTK